MVEKHREKLRAMELEKLKSYRELADELATQSITIEANANDEGHLYGSVGPHEIVDALKQAGFALAQDQIRLGWPAERTRSVHGQSSPAQRSRCQLEGMGRSHCRGR